MPGRQSSSCACPTRLSAVRARVHIGVAGSVIIIEIGIGHRLPHVESEPLKTEPLRLTRLIPAADQER